MKTFDPELDPNNTTAMRGMLTATYEPSTNLLEAHRHTLVRCASPRPNFYTRSYCLFRQPFSEALKTALSRRITAKRVKLAKERCAKAKANQRGLRRWKSGTICGRDSAWPELGARVEESRRSRFRMVMDGWIA